MQPIFSDDPNVIEKLTKKIEMLEAHQEQMKRINKEYKKNPVDYYKHDYAYNIKIYGTPIPKWMLSNNSAVIRQTKKRLQKLLGE